MKHAQLEILCFCASGLLVFENHIVLDIMHCIKQNDKAVNLAI